MYKKNYSRFEKPCYFRKLKKCEKKVGVFDGENV